MQNNKSLEDSKVLYEKTRNYFGSLNFTGCVIEITEKPLYEWTLHFTESEEQMVLKRREFSRLKKPFIAIYTGHKDKYFFFTDDILTQLEILDTGEILLFNIENFESFNLNQVRKEFLELKKILQGA